MLKVQEGRDDRVRDMWSCCPSALRPAVGPSVESDAGEPASPQGPGGPDEGDRGDRREAQGDAQRHVDRRDDRQGGEGRADAHGHDEAHEQHDEGCGGLGAREQGGRRLTSGSICLVSFKTAAKPCAVIMMSPMSAIIRMPPVKTSSASAMVTTRVP